MNKALVIGLVAIAGIFLTLPVLGSLEDSSSPARQQAASSEPAVSEQPAQQSQANQQLPQAQAGPAITANDLVGTSWKIGDYTVALQGGGKMTVNGSIQGNWSLQGNTLKGSAMGQSVTCTVQNGTLYYEGQPARRMR